MLLLPQRWGLFPHCTGGALSFSKILSFILLFAFYLLMGVIRGYFPPYSEEAFSSSVVFLLFYLLGVMRRRSLLIRHREGRVFVSRGDPEFLTKCNWPF
ncbi:MAG: hypothetical protein PWP57_680 [Candidatus Atribacteria bacterium]|nr:hypothetical protein [Candidatus Atribacteria bacterium]